MFVRGYNLNSISPCAKSFLNNNKPKHFTNKPFAYVVRLNDKIKIGSCNNLYNRLSTYNTIYRNVAILNVRGFPTDASGQMKYNQIFANRLAKINGNSYYHCVVNEETILKSIKDLTSGKFNILNIDLKD